MVVDIPAAAGAGIFGSFSDAWQVPLADFGAADEDGGKGGRYLLLPPGHSGPVPDGYLPVPSPTLNGYAVIRVIPVSAARPDVEAAVGLARQITT